MSVTTLHYPLSQIVVPPLRDRKIKCFTLLTSWSSTLWLEHSTFYYLMHIAGRIVRHSYRVHQHLPSNGQHPWCLKELYEQTRKSQTEIVSHILIHNKSDVRAESTHNGC